MMSENRLPVDDPRLTAYALGELSPAEIATIERLLEESAECRKAVDEIRELAGVLSDGLNAEPAPTLSEGQRTAIVHAAGASSRVPSPPKQPAPRHPAPASGRW